MAREEQRLHRDPDELLGGLEAEEDVVPLGEDSSTSSLEGDSEIPF